MLYSVAGGSMTPWAEPQMKRFALGLRACSSSRWCRSGSGATWRGWPMRVSIVLLLLAVEFFGVVGMGAQRWIDLGFMRLQPSELMKITLVMLLAAYYDWLPTRSRGPLWVLIPVLMILLPTYRWCCAARPGHRDPADLAGGGA
jgi:rod shape determining protein RodA